MVNAGTYGELWLVGRGESGRPSTGIRVYIPV